MVSSDYSEPPAPSPPVQTPEPVGDVLWRGALAAFRGDPLGILFVPLAFMTPSYVGAVLSVLWEMDEPDALGIPFTLFTVGVILISIPTSIVASLVSMRRTAAVIEGGESLQETLGGLLQGFIPFVVVSLGFGLAVTIGFFLCLVPGFFALFYWGFSIVRAAVDRTGVADSFQRSAELVKGRFSRWGTGILLLFVFYFIPYFVLSMPSGVAGGLGMHTVQLGASILLTPILFVMNFVGTAVWTSFYLDFRDSWEPSRRV